jgi:hypothetical protein
MLIAAIIVALIVGYTAIGGAVCAVLYGLNFTRDDSVWMGVFWPAVLPYFALFQVWRLAEHAIDRLMGWR